MKKHIDCKWLIKITEDSFRCCDARGKAKGKIINKKEAHEPACQFIHLNNKQAAS